MLISYFCKYFFSMIKNIASLALVLLITCVAMAQSPLPAVDKSPMDMCYYPVRFPNLKAQDKLTEPLAARVIYSRPKKKGGRSLEDWLNMGNCGAWELMKLPRSNSINLR